ncbi:Rieske [2Fe-2S] domain-containing protein [Chitinophaga costaii]|uniref:Rieske [2Fe-2S] domain-containing protein n=1 Tax=Chitinophaga costaii TaxID=1335309 RepID=A0A1C4BCK0_9BACT|nr:Rieske 2Fe-2S domain-containing protein [Chitinophaga costaii]PUZ27662.1 hypothetical protein DCM91_05450 [Chitinophaga costaii]SCC04605.1 Rieske [2Fe-2S] domain-containing protein [Chitinophaga costaii]
MAYKRIPLKPFPNGWYTVAFSHELKNGEILTRRFAGKDIVLFRTVSGALAIIEPYCPHLGGHFGTGGVVEGETIKCPFHYFCFDAKGACTSTGYGTAPSKKLQVPVWHSAEKNGFIMLWFDEKNNPPAWEIPDEDWTGWSEPVLAEYEFDSHPQETTENSVDFGHFSIVHGYTGVETLESMNTDGPYMYARYAMDRTADFVGKKRKVRSQFKANIHGLGYSLVEAEVPELGLEFRFTVMAIPTEIGKLIMRTSSRMKLMKDFSKITPLMNVLPKKLANHLILKNAAEGFAHDVKQDFVIWKKKIYIDPPILAKGDGPVAKYRLWTQQFYYADSVQPDYVPHSSPDYVPHLARI